MSINNNQQFITLTIDGQSVTCASGDTILAAAKQNGIQTILSFCAHPQLKPSGACGICVVEVAGNAKLVRACSTLAVEGQVVSTQTPRVQRVRKNIIELLLSDHKGDCVAPCQTACPAQTDCQGYVGLIALGKEEESVNLLRQNLPLPGSIGRVCPHPCETKCRRKLVEEPISIAALKTFAATSAEGTLPQIAASSGKRIAVVGGGPGGLSAAYFLRLKGHEVTVYDASPQMGGMLLYGVPEYRLPKSVLAKEVAFIAATGVQYKNNVRIGKDITLDQLQKEYDAVIVAIGAQGSYTLGCSGEELQGVISGIAFLRDVSGRGQNALDTTYLSNIKGKNVAVVGGGDTAMDACRTSVRLGASNVYNIYRRTREEMPANPIEIEEAFEEGVEFKFLTNPLSVEGKDGKVSHVRLQKMALGEPDASGRRAPIATDEVEDLAVDTVIVMIGQSIDTQGLSDIALTSRRTIAADTKTCTTNLPGVFAIGDATNKGASIAVEAIGEAKLCARIVDIYVHTGEVIAPTAQIKVTQSKSADDFADEKKIARKKFKIKSASLRRNNFSEVNSPLTPAAAKSEAMRCLECGCAAYFTCKLLKGANDVGADVAAFEGDGHTYAIDGSSHKLVRDMNKCILCGLCVRFCELEGAGVLGLMNRGFDCVVKPELEKPLAKTQCIACGTCASVCPTGALVLKQDKGRTIPLKSNPL